MIDSLRHRVHALGEHPPRWLFVLLWAIWLPFLAPSTLQLFSGHYAPWQTAAALADVGMFVCVYLWAAGRNSLAHSNPAELLLDPPLAEDQAMTRGALAALLGLAGDMEIVAEVAATLHLSEGTVRNCLSVAIQKLDAGNRVEAAHIAEEKGWL